MVTSSNRCLTLTSFSVRLGVLLLALNLTASACRFGSEPPPAEPTAAFSNHPPAGLSTHRFEDHFTLVDSLTFDDEVLVSMIQTLDFSDEGHVLISSLFSQDVYLFSADGELIEELSAEPCHPGFQWTPVDALFLPGGDILVNNGYFGFRFHHTGACDAVLHEDYASTDRIAVDAEGYLYGFYKGNKEEGYFYKKMDPQGRELLRFGQSAAFVNLGHDMYGGGIVTGGQSFVYVAQVHDPRIHTYTTSGEYVGALGFTPTYYRPVKEDISPNLGNVQGIIEELRQLRKTSSHTLDLHLLDKDKLLVIHKNTYKIDRNMEEIFGLMVYDTRGNSLVDGGILTRKEILGAHAGRVYVLHQPDVDEAGEIPNPMLRVYQFQPN